MKMITITITIMIMMTLISCSSSDQDPPPHQLRGLKSFVSKSSGSNMTFDCSPSGPCVPCLYHEKKDVSFRCSETGYRIPMKCVKIDDQQNNKGKNLVEQQSGSHPEKYVTYRSCIPAVNQERLSFLGFEALMLLLLITSSFVIFRRKGSFVMPGAIRLPTHPRF